MKLRPVAQQVVVVMGASSGIGRATALRFAEQRAAVVVSARGEPGLAALVAESGDLGGRATAVVADVTDPAQVQAVANRAVAEYGQPARPGARRQGRTAAPAAHRGRMHLHVVDGRQARHPLTNRLLRLQARHRRLPRGAARRAAARRRPGQRHPDHARHDQHTAG